MNTFATFDDVQDYLDNLEADLRDSADPVSEAGVYRLGSKLYKVQKGKTSGHFYAKQAVGESGWEYAPGAIYRLRAMDRLTLEQARAIGRATGVCVCCGRELTDQVSVDGGIGPVCEKNWFGAGRRAARAKAKV